MRAKPVADKIEDANIGDMGEVLDLHNDAVRNLEALWTEQEQTLGEREAWYKNQMVVGYPVLVARSTDGRLAGYGSYGPFRTRSGYRLTVEHSIYLWPHARGKGLGKALLAELISRAQGAGLHAMIAGIDGGNTVSIGLHKSFGFDQQGILREVGVKNGRWLDLVFMILRLNERAAPL